jgi:hypothetical protein
MKKQILIIFSILLIQAQSYSQNTNLDNYEGERREFQEWLDEIGLGYFYNIYEITSDDDKLSIYFTSYKGNSDELIKEWDRLKNKFDPSSNNNFEKRIFNKMLGLFNVKPENATLQFYDTYDLTKEPCFFVGISMKDGEIESETTRCKTSKDDSSITKSSEQIESNPSELKLQSTENLPDDNRINFWILIGVLLITISGLAFLIRVKLNNKRAITEKHVKSSQVIEIPSNLKKECFELISKGDLSKAINNLKEHYEQNEFVEDYQHLILLENQYNSLMKDKYSNVVSNEFVNIQTSKLTKGILQMLK